MSGLGKGIVSSSIGRLIGDKYKTIYIKCDGYFNVDPGTMNPVEHGEVFVLDDGGEVDLDFGHFERFMNVSCACDESITSGKVFNNIIRKERKGEYLGKTVQLIPHVTNEIKQMWYDVAKKQEADVVIVEIGGTVGDLENLWFLEAARELSRDHDNSLFVHLGLLPVVDDNGQLKTKPLQQSTIFLRERGITPDVAICRAKSRIDDKTKKKIHWFCDVKKEAVVSDPDLDIVYELPLVFLEEGLHNVISDKLNMELDIDFEKWKHLIYNFKNPEKEITIAIVGKYMEVADSYLSVKEALLHCAAHTKSKINVKYVDSEIIENCGVESELEKIDAVIVPGGFGSRGIEGKISAIKFCRENNIPYLGICLGMQLAVVEFARNVCMLEGANSKEINSETKHAVIDIMPEQKAIDEKGGTMRLGSYPAYLKDDSIIKKLYEGKEIVYERHRHRYEVNPEYHDILRDKGMVFAGTDKSERIVEFIELKNHNYFVGTQAHPELKSKFLKPAPMFLGLVKSALENK